MSEWKDALLGDYIYFSTKKVEANRISVENYISTDNLLPNLGGIEPAKNLPNQTKYVAFDREDVLFSNIRTYFKKVWKASFSGGCSNDVLVFKTKNESELRQEYLYCIISSRRFVDYTAFTAKGTKMPRGDKEAMRKYPFQLPKLNEQKEIAKTLSLLDKKIALLHQQNQDLEELAQTLFKRWFVEFEFPNENGEPYLSSGGKMIESELGEIPEGWRVERLDSICDVINGRAYKNSEFKTEGTPIVRIQNVNGGSNYVFSDLDLPPDKYINHDDLIFAWSASFGAFIWRGEKSIYHYHIWKLNCFKPESKLFLFFYLKRITENVTSQGTGSIFSHITKGLMDSQELIIPADDILLSFDSYVSTLNKKISNNTKEFQTLTQLRDTLLPRLMSGELSVNEIKE